MKSVRSVLGRLGVAGLARDPDRVRVRRLPVGVAAAVAVVVVACGDSDFVAAQQSAASAQRGSATAQQSEFIPHFTITEVMASVVMPAADIVWAAPQFPDEGDEILGPSTEEGWVAVRNGAVALAESANLLLVPGRKAHPADKKVNEGELSAAEIEGLIAANRAAWASWAKTLHATALEAVAAVDARDAEKLLDVGGTLDSACEGCHKQFWYPNQEQ